MNMNLLLLVGGTHQHLLSFSISFDDGMRGRNSKSVIYAMIVVFSVHRTHRSNCRLKNKVAEQQSSGEYKRRQQL